jgi:hypothetical protein
MKVKDLIEQLSKFDPETEVLGMCTDPTDFTYKVPIKSIDLGSPFDDSGYSGVDGSESDWDVHYYEDEDMDEPEYVGPKVVLLNLGDV